MQPTKNVVDRLGNPKMDDSGSKVPLTEANLAKCDASTVVNDQNQMSPALLMRLT